MARAVDMSVMSFVRLIFHVGNGNSHNFAVVTDRSTFGNVLI
jgi:hypothetical protein